MSDKKVLLTVECVTGFDSRILDSGHQLTVEIVYDKGGKGEYWEEIFATLDRSVKGYAQCLKQVAENMVANSECLPEMPEFEEPITARIDDPRFLRGKI